MGDTLDKVYKNSLAYKGIFEPIGSILAGPEIPDPIVPDPTPQVGDEGIRQGEKSRISGVSKLNRLKYSRTSSVNDSTLGSIKQQLG